MELSKISLKSISFAQKIYVLNFLLLLIALFSTTNTFSQDSNITVSVNWPAWSSENKVDIFNPSGTLLLTTIDNGYTGGVDNSYSTTVDLGCRPDLSNYYFIMYDIAGDGWDGADNITITVDGVEVVNQNGNAANIAGVRVDFDVSGTAQEIEITGNGNEIIDGDTTPNATDATDFGNILIAGTQAHTFTIKNTDCSSSLTLTGASPYIVISGTNAADFTLTTIPSTPIAGNSNTTFTIEFSPSATGVRTASISIANNDSNENPYNFNIQGTGITDPPIYTIYYENFEANNGGWAMTNPGGTTTVWTYGANTAIKSSEGNHWYTSDYGSYANNSHTYVTSPTIDLTNFNNLVFKVDIEYDTQANFDGINIEYSINGGTTWLILGAYAASPINNWYNDTDINAIGNDIDGWSGVNLYSSTAATHSEFFEASILLPSTLNNQSNVQFRIQFASDNATSSAGVNFDNVFIQGDYITPVATPSTAPGGATANLKTWLKANSGTSTTTDGTALTTWSDEAYDNDAIANITNQPTYNNNPSENINFNPVINFEASLKQEMTGKGGFFSQDYFIVLEPNAPYGATSSGQQIIAGKYLTDAFAFDGSGLAFGRISARYTDAIIEHSIGLTPATPDAISYGRAYQNSSETLSGIMLVNIKTNSSNNSTEIYINGNKIDNATGKADNGNGGNLNFKEFKNLQYYLGTGRFTANGHTIDGRYDGKIAEFLSYAVKNSNIDRRKIQSNLAIKYGITLNSSSLSNETNVVYRNSTNNIIWNPTVDSGGYNYNIAGIGRDDAAGLNQKQSRTVNTSNDITIGLGDIALTNSANANAFSTDDSYLVWGNNNGDLLPLATLTTDMSSGIGGLSTSVSFRNFNKKWKLKERGNVGTVKISVPTSILIPATTTPRGDYYMFISSDGIFTNTSKYKLMTLNGANLETTYNFTGTEYITFGYAEEKTFERSIAFDGIDDYLEAGNASGLNLAANFTVSAWINRAPSTSAGVYGIISKKNNSPYTEGYALRISNSGKCVMVWKDAGGSTQKITSNVAIPENEWHHVAVIYDGTDAKMYIDGVLSQNQPKNPPVVNTHPFLIAAVHDTPIPTKHFEGKIDEVRIWNIALSENQLRYIMNQEIENNSGLKGSYFETLGVTPTKNEISAISWTNLQGYYPMSTYTYTNTKDMSDNDYTAAVRNLNTVDYQTAPLPYQSSGSTTDWNLTSTWANGTMQTIPGTASIVDNTKTVDWNIVEINHNITMNNNSLPTSALGNNNRNLLSLKVNANKLTVAGNNTAVTGNGLTITHYLKLDGVIDLEGESQLIQTEHSDLDVNSVGYIEKDQQGTENSFTYNYWSSPVSAIGAGTNNTPYKILDILKDGTNPITPITLNFEAGTTLASTSPYYADGALSNPRKIAKRWMYTYSYGSSWVWAGNNAINVADGYIMKGNSGTGAITNTQNYTFIGKPNNVLNGNTEIVHTTLVAPADPANSDVFALTGNPFPSAIDADAFITNNLAATDGQIYLWEHWGGGSHVKGDYEGGYAIYTIAGGVVAPIHPSLNTPTGNGTKTPEQYIPVGQGFYVIASATGGDVVFKNTQRVFQKKGATSLFVKNSNTTTESTNNTSGKQRIWLGFESPSGYYRQVLAAFLEGATDNFDKGYDGLSGDILPNDAFFIQDDKHYVIQAFGEFNEDREIPITIIINEDNHNGVQKFMVDKLENFPNDVDIYIKDNTTGETHDIRNQSFEIALASGEHKTRFSLVFKAGVLGIDDITALENNLLIYMDNNATEIIIKKTTELVASKITLTNYLGQTLYSWKKNLDKNILRLPVTLNTGIYIISYKTKKGIINKKLFIK